MLSSIGKRVLWRTASSGAAGWGPMLSSIGKRVLWRIASSGATVSNTTIQHTFTHLHFGLTFLTHTHQHMGGTGRGPMFSSIGKKKCPQAHRVLWRTFTTFFDHHDDTKLRLCIPLCARSHLRSQKKKERGKQLSPPSRSDHAGPDSPRTRCTVFVAKSTYCF